MKYISLDIETTGLNPHSDQVLQIAMIKDDLREQKPIEQLEKLNIFIKHERLSGHPYALALNHKILSHPDAIISFNAKHRIMDFLSSDKTKAKVKYPKGGHVFAGKNIWKTDLAFLLSGGYIQESAVHHRSIDPAMFYIRSGDEVVPGLSQCLARAGFSDHVSHDALDDAVQVIQLVRDSLGHLYKDYE